MDESTGAAGEHGHVTINATFEEQALLLFREQYAGCAVYRSYVDALRRPPAGIDSLEKIPFLPISFFKTLEVKTGAGWEAEAVFESSGTTGGADSRSKHFVRDISLYKNVALQGFRQVYGPPQDYIFLALLPGYTERKNSSLVAMVQMLMEESGHPLGGFYLNEPAALLHALDEAKNSAKKVLLIGVTFALLDLAEQHPMDLSGNVLVMETGGMKGRREERTRDDIHRTLKRRWNLQDVHSEYGMTELLSQGYSMGGGIYRPIDSMRVLAAETDDPLTVHRAGTGVLQVIDLANRHSCAFIATEDLGRVADDGSFEVLGRMDHSALRGCSLMTA